MNDLSVAQIFFSNFSRKLLVVIIFFITFAPD